MPMSESFRQLSGVLNLHERILNSITDFAIIATNSHGQIVYWGAGAMHILGWTPEEVLGQSVRLFFTPEDNAIGRPETEMQETTLLGRSLDERWHLRKNGQRFWASGELMPIKDEENHVIGFVKVLADRTQQKVVVADILEQHSELENEVATRTLERDRIWAVSRDLIVTLGGSGTFRSLNPAFTSELGYPEGALVNAHFDVIIHPEDLAAAHVAFAQMISGPPITNFDSRIRAYDGTYRWYSWTSSAENGLIYAYGRDVSARKELEVRNRETQRVDAERRLADLLSRQTLAERDRLHALFEHAPSFMAVLRGPNHVFELANPAFQQLVGDRELIGKPIREAFPEVEGQGVFELLDSLYISAKTFTARDARLFLQKSPGTAPVKIFVDLLYQPLRNAEGNVTGIFVDGYEVTERKRSFDALRELNETLEERVREKTDERNRLWEHSPDLITQYSTEGVLVDVNPAFLYILGYDSTEIVGKSFTEFLHPEDIAITENKVADSANLAQVHVVNRWRHKDGTYRWISWATNNNNETLFAVGRDITEEKIQAEALRQAEEALRQAQKMEAVGQLTGGIAHDFNNMLAGVMGNLEMLEIRISQGRIEDVAHYTDGAKLAVNRAAALTHRLLAFSRRQTLDPICVDVNNLIVSLGDLIKRTLGTNILFETALAGGMPSVLCDVNQLENALLNLAINSRDAMPEGGRLTIETSKVTLDAGHVPSSPEVMAGEYVRICVSDTGVGMPQDVLKRALDPFFTTKPIGQGTGLGLSMVYGFVKQSKGHLHLYSEPGIGTTVQLFLPQSSCSSREPREKGYSSEIALAKGSATILLVEDDDSIRTICSEMLTDLGYTIFQASNGIDGLARLQTIGAIDLLITDVGLPHGMNGRQLADAGREIKQSLKVLFITGFAEIAAIGNGLLEPGMQVMTKPFSMATFASKVQAIIESN